MQNGLWKRPFPVSGPSYAEVAPEEPPNGALAVSCIVISIHFDPLQSIRCISVPVFHFNWIHFQFCWILTDLVFARWLGFKWIWSKLIWSGFGLVFESSFHCVSITFRIGLDFQCHFHSLWIGWVSNWKRFPFNQNSNSISIIWSGFHFNELKNRFNGINWNHFSGCSSIPLQYEYSNMKSIRIILMFVCVWLCVCGCVCGCVGGWLNGRRIRAKLSVVDVACTAVLKVGRKVCNFQMPTWAVHFKLWHLLRHFNFLIKASTFFFLSLISFFSLSLFLFPPSSSASGCLSLALSSSKTWRLYGRFCNSIHFEMALVNSQQGKTTDPTIKWINSDPSNQSNQSNPVIMNKWKWIKLNNHPLNGRLTGGLWKWEAWTCLKILQELPDEILGELTRRDLGEALKRSF